MTAQPTPTTRVEPQDRAHGRFLPPDGRAEIAVIIVTHNSADDLPSLLASLRAEATGIALRVVVVDNGSSDASVTVARGEGDVIVRTEGNLGYAGGINVAMGAIGETAAIFVANPDLVVEPGCLTALHRAMRETGAGIVVPAILDGDGRPYPSLRREPSILTALGDAAFGGRLTRRPGALSEIVFDARAYARRHTIDWATGAALLIDSRVAAAVGDWDERFFLYSEETDFFRRAREAGFRILFEPAGRVRHSQGGSGSSAELDALLEVNRVRYARKHHGPAWSAAFRTAVALHSLARASSPAHRLALRALTDRSARARLPHAEASPAAAATEPPPARAARPVATGGTLIIPAHNEAAVLGRTLTALAPALAAGVEVTVACNGCSDDTADLARRHDGVTVIELATASKTAAMNAAGRQAGWPRMYLDADIVVDPRAVHDVFAALAAGTVLAARPPFRYETDGASALVRSYYRARTRMPSTSSGLWGAGAYALAADCRERVGEFPPVTADDLWIDRQFAAHEKAVIDTAPTTVRTPRTSAALLNVLRRTYRGNRELRASERSAGSGMLEAFRPVRGPVSAWDALVYLAFASTGRLLAGIGRDGEGWERDESSRTGGAR